MGCYMAQFIKGEKMKKILHELNYLKIENIFNIIIFLLSLLPTIIYKIYIKISKKRIWLICEDPLEARDNGFSFFKYLRNNHNEIDTYYAIKYKSADYDKVRKIGKTVKYGSIKHWILYFNCRFNISSQKAGNPDCAICYVLERFGINKNKNVFLQHGITINKATWLFYKNCKIRLFICGADPEYRYIIDNFGYPEGYVVYTGFSRFDDYHKIKPVKNQIVLMPSWREWIASKNEFSKIYENSNDFTKTEYFRKYQELINDRDLISFLESKGIVMYFYPHRNMQKYIKCFETRSKNIKIVSNKKIDIKDLLINSSLMITDYSSVAMDFAYMKKPVIYFQFDEKKFREAQYDKGYFDYRNDGFGSVCMNSSEIVKELKKSYKNNFKVDKSFSNNHKKFFPLYDCNNNERIYEEICKL